MVHALHMVQKSTLMDTSKERQNIIILILLNNYDYGILMVYYICVFSFFQVCSYKSIWVSIVISFKESLPIQLLHKGEKSTIDISIGRENWKIAPLLNPPYCLTIWLVFKNKYIFFSLHFTFNLFSFKWSYLDWQLMWLILWA